MVVAHLVAVLRRGGGRVVEVHEDVLAQLLRCRGRRGHLLLQLLVPGVGGLEPLLQLDAARLLRRQLPAQQVELLEQRGVAAGEALRQPMGGGERGMGRGCEEPSNDPAAGAALERRTALGMIENAQRGPGGAPCRSAGSP